MIRTRRLALLVAMVLALTLAGSRPAVADTGGTPTGVGLPALPIQVPSYNIPDSSLNPMTPNVPPGSHSPILWGYEAEFTGARILQYDIAAGGTFQNFCIPPGSQDGRGLAFDPMDGNLWYTWVDAAAFNGTGFIYKVTPPTPTSAGCAPVGTPLLVHAQGVNTTIQSDFGALDVDQGSMHIWAAGYKPIQVGSDPTNRSYFYLVNRNTGGVIQSCWRPFKGGGIGNDSLAYARISGLPGSGQYILSDEGEGTTSPNSVEVIDTSTCHQGKEAQPVFEYSKAPNATDGTAGIEYEWPGLINTTGEPFSPIYVRGGPLGATPALGPATETLQSGAPFGLEDISLCGFRAGGPGNDKCPY
jgi:hypothetical protein